MKQKQSCEVLHFSL